MTSFRTLKQRLRKLFLPPRLTSDIEAIRLNQGKMQSAMNRSTPLDRLNDTEFSVFSQFGEDGIIQRLISAVPIAHRTFIEFGIEDFVESNCRFLLMNNNWSGFVLDGSPAWIAALHKAPWLWKFDVRAECALVTRDNINTLLERSGFDRDLGILSIDVDGVDYWLLDAITSYAPRILVVEYNALFGAERAITVPYDAALSRRQKHHSDLYFGASLGALAHAAARKGYALVGTESSGVNAFFVRNDVLGDIPALSVAEAFHACKVRQSRDREGRLNYLRGAAQLAEIAGMPVVNVVTGELETL